MEEILSNAMGTFTKLDNFHSKGFIGTYLRFKVSMDVTKPLRRMINIEGLEGQEFQIHLAYERLPNFFLFLRHTRPSGE